MKTIKVIEATNTQLDWLVAIASGWSDVQISDMTTHGIANYCFFRPTKVVDDIEICGGGLPWSPTNDWNQMGPIIEKESINISAYYKARTGEWLAWCEYGPSAYGTSPLIAAARCYVLNKLGEQIEVPDEL